MLRFFFNFLLAILIFGILSTVVISAYIVPRLPDIETLKDVKLQVPLRIYSQDLSLIAEFGEKRRSPINSEEINTVLIQAFLAAEDDRFYVHPGVDWQSIARAVYSLMKTGTKKQGGSTITMQVARNFFLSREKTYLRKLNEIFLALKIERELSKDKILELYLNKIYLGQRAYGVAAAAYVYYGTDINSLTLPQMAMIAGLPKAPSTTNPISNPKRALIRRNYVLQRMLSQSYISEKEYEKAVNTPISASLHTPFTGLEAPYVAEIVRKDLIEDMGDDAYSSGMKIITTIQDKNQRAANQALRKALMDYDKRHGYRGTEHHASLIELDSTDKIIKLLDSFPVLADLYPALVMEVNEQSIIAHLGAVGEVEIGWDDLKWARKFISENRRGAEPKFAEDILKQGDVIRLAETDEGSWQLAQIPEVEGGLVSLNPNDGSLLALTGGFDFYRNKFNRVIQARRQPGSGFKPFIYSSALAAGKTAASIINDAPIVFDDAGVEDAWRPENYSRKSYGPTRLKEALTHSRNLVSIRLLNEIGVDFALTHLRKFGFSDGQLSNNLSLALGSAEVTLWEMARAYSVFANGGYLIDPYYIDRIETYDHEMLFQHIPQRVCRSCEQVQDEIIADAGVNNSIAPRVVDARNVWIMNSITQNVIKNGTGRRALQLGRNDLSGKTGTTNDQYDAWFSGFNADVVAISWVGFDEFKPLGSRETGARGALPMWIDYMRVALDNMPESTVERPTGLITVRIDPETGKLARADNENAIFEVFRTEFAPKVVEEQRQPDTFLPDPNADRIPEQLF